jgi:hypothetical protein
MLQDSNILFNLRRFTMFQFKSVVDQVAQATKMPLTMVEDKTLRNSLEAVVDAQTKFVKSFYDTNLDLAKQAVEKAKEYDYSKPFAELASEFLAK